MCIDTATKSGFAIAKYSDEGYNVVCWTLDMTGSPERFLDFYHELWRVYKEYKPTILVYEKVFRHKGVWAAHVYGGFLGILHLFSAMVETELDFVGVGTAKKATTGNGNASKLDVIAAVSDKFGFTPTDDNEADAVAIFLGWLRKTQIDD